ncbi:hypothetical protein P8631_11470 (plasmid) [Guyparkeria sp. 1SP6A2]|nr:hypothetical protein [Guyparkeria sp. 1SP6A2]
MTEPYLDENRPQNQERIDGVIVDPNLPPSFVVEPIDDRDRQQIKDWWGVAYVTTQPYHQIDASYADFCARMGRYGSTVQEPEAEWKARVDKQRASWFEAWPEGVRYDVHCLDGGAWDRPTSRGMFPTLHEAIARALALNGEQHDER